MAETFTGQGGMVSLRHIPSRWVREFLAKYPSPAVPTYEVRTVAGDVLHYEHDEKSVEQTPGAREEWEAYLVEERRASNQRTTDLHKFLIVHCIEESPQPPDEWPLPDPKWGIGPPDDSDPDDYKVRWVEEVIAPGAKAYLALVLRLYEMSGIAEDRLRAIEAFFRLTLAREAA